VSDPSLNPKRPANTAGDGQVDSRALGRKQGRGRSLYLLLAGVIATVVVTILGGSAIVSYHLTKTELTLQMREQAERGTAALVRNMAPFMESFAANEYANLVRTEVELHGYLAITVRDRNLGVIQGEPEFVSGFVRSPAGLLLPYRVDSAEQQQWLGRSFHQHHAEVRDRQGALLGDVNVYLSDAALRRQLNRDLAYHLGETALLVALLGLVLFFALRRMLVRPLEALADGLRKHDADGIPVDLLPIYPYREIALLSHAVNRMVTIIRQSRQALEAEQETLERTLNLNRVILETIPDLLWLKDSKGRYRLCNPPFERFFGASEADIIGKTDYDFVDPELAEFFRTHDQKAMQAGKPIVNEEWITLASNGRRVLLETTKVAVVLGDGEVFGVLGIGHDITEHYQNELELQQRNARDQALNLALPVGVLAYDETLQQVVFANDSAAAMLEMDHVDLIGHDLSQVGWRRAWPEGETPAPLNANRTWIDLAAANQAPQTLLRLDFGHFQKWLQLHTVPFTVNGAPAGAVTSLMDLTREQETIRALDRERKRFQIAIEGSQDGLWDWDVVGGTVFYSPRWKQMLGYQDFELGNQFEEWQSRVHPDDLYLALHALHAHLHGEAEVYESRHRLQCRDGSWLWTLARGKALFDEHGQPIRMVAFQSNIAREMRHQEELEHSAKHDALTGLPNRFLFNELVQRLMHRCQRGNTLLALLFIDLDGFKAINDRFGHEAGDRVLVTVSRRMLDVVRREDVVARLGGDEFVIAITDLDSPQALTPLLERLLSEIERPIAYRSTAEHQLEVSASIGVSLYPQAQELDADTLLRQADQAMYEAKYSGKNQYQFFNQRIEQNANARPEARRRPMTEPATGTDQAGAINPVIK